MIGGKTNASNRPSALGTLLNQSAYGSTIPTIHGTCRTGLMAIWAANLRKGGSGKKSKKKGVSTYVENVDFLIGSNPIEAMLQIWSNNTNRYTLDYKVQSYGGNAYNPTVSDANFYWLIGVTASVTTPAYFNDYGALTTGAILTTNLMTFGSGYNVGDTFSVDGGTSPATAVIVGVGVFFGYQITNGGSGYTVGTTYTTTTLTGGGSGLTLEVAAVGTGASYNTTEFPLWNAWQHGSDVNNAGAYRFWPWTYIWRPSDGASIPWINTATFFEPLGLTAINVYYAATNKTTKHEPPIAYNRMAFENQLGNGTEFADAGLTSQQIIYPYYAGAGSSDIDLGASGMLPDWRCEVKGSNYRYARGDADFADMIEDTIRSGVIQTGNALGLIQRGVNCNDIPGIVQKVFFGQLEPTSPSQLTYYQPNAVGSILINIDRWRPSAGSPPTTSDTAGNTWTPVVITDSAAMWWAKSVGWPAGNLVSDVFNGGGFAYDNRHFIFEMDPYSDTIEDSQGIQGVTTVNGQNLTLSVTITKPSYVIAFADIDGTITGNPVVSPLWKSLINDPFIAPTIAQISVGGPIVVAQYFPQAGTYSFTVNGIASAGTLYTIGMLAISQSNPTGIPKALGNILDPYTLGQCRTQCQANGLVGSISMNQQRDAKSWLEEFYKCANTAPVWSGDLLKSIPRSEVSIFGGGIQYTSPTASGPVATLTEDDLVGTPPMIVDRRAQTNSNNVFIAEFTDRANDYNIEHGSIPESSAVTMFGPRKESPITLHEICDPNVAQLVLAIEVRREVYLRKTYKFTLRPKWVGLEAMDLILINEPKLNIINLPVRIQAVKENDKFELEVEAEDFFYGLHAPNVDFSPSTVVAPNNADSTVVPGPVNPPVIFEPPLRMSFSGQPELWVVDSNADPNAGGSLVYVSVDGGATYSTSPVGTINGNAPTGYVQTTDFPAADDPDSTDVLDLDLTESNGVLPSFTADEENSFLYPSFLGATPSPTPTVVATGNNSGSSTPTQCISFAPPSPVGGYLPSDVVLFFAKQRDVIDGNTAFFFGPGLVPNPTNPSIIQPIGGLIRLSQSNDACGNVDPLIIAIYDEHTFTCPCFGSPLPVENFYGTGPGGGHGFNYDWAWASVALRNAGSAVSSFEVATGALGSTVVLDEATFNSSSLSGGAIGGTAVVVVKVWGAVPGNPALFIAMVAGASSATPPSGWTWVGGTIGCEIFSQVGTEVQTPNAYELVTYQSATLVAANQYSIDGTVEPIRRAVFGVPYVRTGIDHNIGSRYAYLDSWQVQAPPGIVKLTLDATWINKTLYFKLVPFNNLGSGFGDLSSAVAYAYMPVGQLPGSGGGGGGTIGGGTGQPGQPGQLTYSISGGTLSNPSSTTIAMANATATFSNGSAVYYNTRTFTIPLPTAPTTYYVTIFDPNFTGDVGTATTLTAQAQATSNLVGVPGYVYIGSITVLPAGGGTDTTVGGYPPPEQILVNGV